MTHLKVWLGMYLYLLTAKEQKLSEQSLVE